MTKRITYEQARNAKSHIRNVGGARDVYVTDEGRVVTTPPATFVGRYDLTSSPTQMREDIEYALTEALMED